MRALHTLGKTLFTVGIAGFVGAVAWWIWFYSQLLGEDVKKASECFYRITQECAAGEWITNMASDVPPYRPELLWGATGLAVIGIILVVGAGHRRTVDG